jgi:RimJ/RimL family protein N-acetyltransferase
MRVDFRAVELGDFFFLFRLAADRETVRSSLSQRSPTLLGHLRWFVRAYFGAGTIVAVVDGRRVGRVTVGSLPPDMYGEIRLRSEVGIVISPAYRGRGYATAILKKLGREYVRPRVLYARIRPQNSASLAAFRKAGFGSADSDEWRWVNAAHEIPYSVLRKEVGI